MPASEITLSFELFPTPLLIYPRRDFFREQLQNPVAFIYDLQGRIVRRIEIEINHHSLFRAKFLAGMYTLMIRMKAN